jgi:exodeoxyribonuclease VII small subunit
MAKQPTKEKDSEAAPPFEESLGELEAIVKQLESSDLPLEKSIELFERGVKLSDDCRKQLIDAETRVEILMKRGSQVEPEEFDAGEE